MVFTSFSPLYPGLLVLRNFAVLMPWELYIIYRVGREKSSRYFRPILYRARRRKRPMVFAGVSRAALNFLRDQVRGAPQKKNCKIYRLEFDTRGGRKFLIYRCVRIDSPAFPIFQSTAQRRCSPPREVDAVSFYPALMQYLDPLAPFLSQLLYNLAGGRFASWRSRRWAKRWATHQPRRPPRCISSNAPPSLGMRNSTHHRKAIAPHLRHVERHLVR